MDSGSWTFETNDKLDASLRASLKNAIVDTSLAAEFDHAQSKKWKIEVTGLSYDSVDPASIQANFDNETCTDVELNWFKEKQFVATEALKAASVSVKADSALSDSERAKLDVAIDKLNTDLHTSFSHTASTGNSAAFTASNVYIGVNGTTLASFDCKVTAPLEVASDVQTPLCDGKYLVALSKSAMNGRYALKVTPQRAATSELDAPLGSQAVFKLNKLQVLFAMAQATGDRFVLQTFEVLKVGAKG